MYLCELARFQCVIGIGGLFLASTYTCVDVLLLVARIL